MNISRQTNDDGCSMYLSFDAESTISSAAFKTLEATNLDDSVEEEKNGNKSNLNNTLEAAEEEYGNFNEDYLATVKKSNEKLERKEIPTMSKSVFKFKANSSTPTKAQLARNVEFLRGSSEHKMPNGLALAFSDIEEEANIYGGQQIEDNKENAHPDSEGSTLSASSSSVDMTNTAIERKMATIYSTFEEMLQEKTAEKYNILEDASEASAKIDVVIKMHNKAETVSEEAVVKEEDKTNETKKDVPRRSILAPKIFRKLNSEPDLALNRPSRIQPDTKKRFSTALTTTAMKSISEIEPAEDIPNLFNKILKIGRELNGEVDEKKTASLDKHKSSATDSKGRSSLLPTAQKRNVGFAGRMSTVVKTTLNSPARKIPRKSIAFGKIVQVGINNSSAGSFGRKSMLPTAAAGKSQTGSKFPKTATTKSGDIGVLQVKNRKSVFYSATAAPVIDPQNNGNGVKTFTSQKLKSNVPSFVCNICKNSFRVKSLLDAHKRSHETDIPAFAKKPTTTATAMAAPQVTYGTMKQCKYCDRKFALERTLHIHLMQNCAKIPPSEKRKLHFTEMDHVEKAQLPDFSNLHNSHANSSSNSSNGGGTVNGSISNAGRKVTHARKTALSSPNSLPENEEIDILTHKLVAAIDVDRSQQMAAPSTIKIKKKTATSAHAGVYRTPNKSVQCHKCKLTFMSILDHISHNMTVHGNCKSNQETTYKLMDMAMSFDEFQQQN